ncbi:2-phosphosulfolactate phosphatase [Bythopirellula goksoeyrii]|uniref:Probable 2-phosphosulfolactate phosphatase n=1 Tax=Bythopirellula goksoeyrii TaxID=1400387 RepID=A0A5B9QFV6_9BACT|nr:2-phosphosulfolactate phosphatase [Bythopirellula goksoeyrii]QEG33153.1 putative 2-phosphosulfolactate phosphatase [Bythopirellula goksoeyrii]
MGLFGGRDAPTRSSTIPQSEFRIPLILNVHYLPQFVAESDLAGSTVIVVDLLRASTTICHALKAGASAVVPLLEIGDVADRVEKLGRENVVLGGERGGELIEGFDLGNSPAEYTPDQVFGRTVLFTTTNGTRALLHSRIAERVFVGAAVNRVAVATAVLSAQRVDILCAGTNGIVTREDILAAGAITDEMLRLSGPDLWQTNEWADSAHREWQELLIGAKANRRSPSEQLAWELKSTPGGKNLLAIGHEEDLRLCAQLDTLAVVPEWDSSTGQITLR